MHVIEIQLAHFDQRLSFVYQRLNNAISVVIIRQKKNRQFFSNTFVPCIFPRDNLETKIQVFKRCFISFEIFRRNEYVLSYREIMGIQYFLREKKSRRNKKYIFPFVVRLYV